MDLLNPYEQTLRFVRSGMVFALGFSQGRINNPRSIALVGLRFRSGGRPEELKASLRLYMLYLYRTSTLKP
jgi:hypothetical protein